MANDEERDASWIDEWPAGVSGLVGVHRRVGAETDSLTITGSHTPLTIPRASLRCPGLGKLLRTRG